MTGSEDGAEIGWARQRGQGHGTSRNTPRAATTRPLLRGGLTEKGEDASTDPARNPVTDVSGRLGALKARPVRVTSSEAVCGACCAPGCRMTSLSSPEAPARVLAARLWVLAPLSPAMGRSRRTGAHRTHSLARQMKAKRRRPDLDEIHRELRPQVSARPRPDPGAEPDPDLPGGGLHRCLACA